jgi:hypothetical protein
MRVEAGGMVSAQEIVVLAKVVPFSDSSLYLGTKSTTRRMGKESTPTAQLSATKYVVDGHPSSRSTKLNQYTSPTAAGAMGCETPSLIPKNLPLPSTTKTTRG